MTSPKDANENSDALKRALFALKDMRVKLDAVTSARTEPIAILGMGCRFPGGANSPDAFWKLLIEGQDAITEVPAERWNVDAYYDPDPNVPGKMYVRKSGFIDNVDKFDPQFFGISPREAFSMDPQQRILLEASWEALEQASIIPSNLAGSQTGVFVGMSSHDYGIALSQKEGLDNIDAYAATGGSFSVAAGRIAYVLGLHGPTLTLDTACSSSLVAVHLACQSLRSGQSDLALAGGVGLIILPDGTVTMSKLRALSSDGYCKTFDASADGYGRGEGCGVVVLKRLSDALADRDHILALIRGSAVNHDGRSSGLTVPSGLAQQMVIRAALADSGGIEARQVQFVETHGTGTQLGDPIEVRALAGALGKDRSMSEPLILGSVKANIGHLEAAAGMAGLIKAILAFQNEKIPAQLHFHNPNPNIDWASLPVKVAGENETWRRGDTPRIAGLNSFGFSGTNAHIVLEEAPLPKDVSPTMQRPQHLLTLSAQDGNALMEMAKRYAGFLEHHASVRLEDAAYTANSRRTKFNQRLAVIGKSPDEIRDKLIGFVSSQAAGGVIVGQTPQSPETKIAFLFTGQGSQYVDMGRQLFETQPVFRSSMERCNELLRPFLERPLLSVLYPEAGEDTPINETAYTQPALFALEYSLAELWRSWGIRPSAVMGHSVGEYVAACVAGVFSLEDGLKLIAERGRLMQSLPHDGAMAAVFTNRERVERAIAPYLKDVSIAAFNGPENIVISGRESSVQAILDDLSREGIKATRLSVSHAFHSPLMEPILDPFEKVAASITYSKPRVALLSNVTGEMVSGEEVTRPSYWREHIRRAVQFQAAMETLRDRGYRVFLEVGPQPTLLAMSQHCIPGDQYLRLASLRQHKDEWTHLLESLGKLYVHGMDIDWEGLHQMYAPHRIPLPTYPFQGKRYWFGAQKKPSHREREMIHPLISRRVRSPKWNGMIFEAELGVGFPSFLNDHRIYETAIFPGTGYMEIALGAASHAFNGRRCSLEGMVIREALTLPNEGEKTVQITISALESDQAFFDIFSLDENANGEDLWKHHASGTITLTTEERALPNPVDIDSLKLSCPNAVDVSSFYSQLAASGIQYGPAFQSISQMWRGEEEAFGFINLSAEEKSESHKHQLHPALLDAAFQVLGAAIPGSLREGGDTVYVPIGLQALKVYQTGQSQAWVQVSFSSAMTKEDGSLKDELQSDIRLYRQNGLLIAEAIGLKLRQISRASILRLPQPKPEDWMYEIQWELSPRSTAETPLRARHWLIFADKPGVGAQLAKRLKSEGMIITVVRPGDAYGQLEENTWQLDPTCLDHFKQLFSDLQINSSGARPRIIHLWGVDNPFDGTHQKTDGLLREAQKQACEGILNLVQALAGASISPDGLWFLTQGVHAIRPEDRLQGMVQTSIWGLARTISMEYPNWKCICLDFAPDSSHILSDEILNSDAENQIALRGNERYVARLQRFQPKSSELVVPADESFELVNSSPGVLDGLTLQTVQRRVPEAGEVEIRVLATGLNFRDVLNALGMYPGPKIPLGAECAGIIVAVGPGVTDFKLGDEVIVFAPNAFRSHATIALDQVFHKPLNFSLAQAAAIPTAFLTASYGLNNLAGMKAGDRVLIHAAAGGVGLAAVQLALRAGAEIFGTAGSPEKRAYLQSIGVQHVFDSRNLDFADQIMQVTNGKGVNIVLNSLADEFIPKSLSVLADHGYFLEMGKRDDWDQAKVSRRNATHKYYRYDLGTEMVNRMAFIGAMLKDLIADFEKEILKPLPLHAFPMESVRDAFRYMAQARHIGKIVITQAEQASVIDQDGTYLITGGLGGLGLVTARWMVEKGATHLVLMSRSEPTEQACQVLDELRQGGTEIVTLQGDVARREDVEGVLAFIKEKLPPLRGLFHEAGVLEDGVLSKQDWSRFEKVLNPKVSGAWHLHELTQSDSLDFFILFSSAAAAVGSAGQGNYAAANAFLDGLAQYRKAHGLPGTSINWGAWADVGMAAEVDSHRPNPRRARGVGVIKPSDGTRILEHLLTAQPTQTVVLPIDWNIFGQGQAEDSIQPLFRQLVKAIKRDSAAGPEVNILERLKTLSLNEQETALQGYIWHQVTRILALDPSQSFEPLKLLTDLGMDSLMAVELKNKIEGDLGINVPVSYFLENASLAELSRKLVQQLRNDGMISQTVIEDDKSIDSEKAKALLENLDQLSEDDVDSLLSTLLTKNEES